MTQAVTCPGCQYQIAIDDSPQQNELNQVRSKMEELEKEAKMPSYIPNFKCTDGNCGKIHPSLRYTRRPKGKCSNCDQFSSAKEGTCPWCKEEDSLEEIDKDDLEDLGIRLPD